MQKSITSPSAAMHSTDDDYVTSQPNTITKTAAKAHTLHCGRAGCPGVIVYDAGTDWPTVSCLMNDHALVCKGGRYGLTNLPPRSDVHSAQHALCPPRLVPASWGIHGSNRDEVIAGGSGQRINEDQRKQELENDEDHQA
ncbi:hypothetical protein CY34DRAFT_802222 [Suillus luteus UH-Slu-Lm8-n1]|uniref:Uncharacterized protein n=1 Tax=Suillus luteus UH-Slu-Lm8-n1 TaxID=930992 RepID=A0A0D0ASZ8_9AGAM|nr:hypothetical protein CY34DRAFT_802222 [Suillus luteus UH-Slu-Lm8-n1]